MPQQVYRIRHWAKWYEKSHKGSERAFAWVAVPTRHDGKGFRRLMRRQNGMALFAAFILMLEVAAKMPTRGILADEDGPLDPRDLADATGGDEAVFSQAISVLTDESEKICWLEVSKSRDLSRQVPPTGQDSTGQDKTEHEVAQATPACPPQYPPGFLRIWGMSPAQARDRSSRKKAFSAWKRQKLEQSAAIIASGLSAWIASAQWTNEGGKFIPGLHKWLAEEKWADPPAATDPQTSHYRDATREEVQQLFAREKVTAP